MQRNETAMDARDDWVEQRWVWVVRGLFRIICTEIILYEDACWHEFWFDTISHPSWLLHSKLKPSKGNADFRACRMKLAHESNYRRRWSGWESCCGKRSKGEICWTVVEMLLSGWVE